MAHGLQTKPNFGEEEGSEIQTLNSSNDTANAAPPSLKDALSSFPNEYSKLVEQGVTELNDLLYVTDKELDEVCNEIGLSGIRKIKFKSNIRSLQRQYAHRGSTSIVAVSMQEQQDMKQIQYAMKQTDGARDLLEKHLNQIDEHVKTLKSSVDEEVQNIISSLQNRKEAVYAQIDAWKSEKEKSVNSEIADLLKLQSDLQNANNECTAILRGNDLVVNREKKIREKVQAILGLNYSQNSMRDRITKAIAMATISFDADNTLISNIDSYGIFKENGTNPIFEMPNITLDEPMKSSDTANGCKVRLKWSTSKEADDVNDFSVRFRLSNSDDDDEKKAVDEWKMAKYGQIEKIENTKFAANIDTEMAFNVDYEYKVGLNIFEPFPMKINSNVMQFRHDGKPSGAVVQVPLKMHSRRGCYSTFYAKYLLTPGDFYASPHTRDFAANENDWIIFTVNSDLYFPTKFSITNCGHASGKRDVKTMKIWIGDGQNEWHAFQPSIINVEKSKAVQTFEIDGVASAVIQRKKLSCFKIEFVTNHGESNSTSCKYEIRAFQLFGVKY